MNSEKNLKILLLGNGLNRAYGNQSWNGLLKSFGGGAADYNSDNCPEPLKAVILSNDCIDVKLKECKHELYGKISADQAVQLQKLLSAGFDEILTTNYSYELELAGLNQVDKDIKDYQLKKMTAHTSEVSNCETKYLLHTYNVINCNGINNRIWHIHGEARKPSSIILGHYYYAAQLSRLLEISRKRGNIYESFQNKGRNINIDSWFDAFIMADIYVIGLGCTFSEMDLWWLINRKKREKAEHGKVYFFEILQNKDEAAMQSSKYALLKLMGCDVKTFICENSNWQAEYSEVIQKICNQMRMN